MNTSEKLVFLIYVELDQTADYTNATLDSILVTQPLFVSNCNIIQKIPSIPETIQISIPI
jgi:hypothetical protein